jgi:hypothetical protein
MKLRAIIQFRLMDCRGLAFDIPDVDWSVVSLNLVSGLVRGGRVNYNTTTTNVLTPRLLFDSSLDVAAILLTVLLCLLLLF